MKKPLFDNVKEKKFRFIYFFFSNLIDFTFTNRDLIEGDGKDEEHYYVIQDYIEEIDNLELGETMYIQGSRDNEQTKGVILRLK